MQWMNWSFSCFIGCLISLSLAAWKSGGGAKPGQLGVGGLDLFVSVGSAVSVSGFVFASVQFHGVLGRLTSVV